MTDETRNRAIKSLLEHFNISADGYHYDRMYVVGDKLFVFELPAIRYSAEATGFNKKVEIVTLEQAMLAKYKKVVPVKSKKIDQKGDMFPGESVFFHA